MTRTLTFEPTPAVQAARNRDTYVPCPVCDTKDSQHLFYKRGVRFVRCASCALVYVNPTGGPALNYFDIEASGQYRIAHDRQLLEANFAALLGLVEASFAEAMGRTPRKAVLVGRHISGFLESSAARQMGLRLANPDDSQFQEFRDHANVEFLVKTLQGDEDVIILNEFLEGTNRTQVAVRRIEAALGSATWLVVAYANIDSLPARLLRRYWPHFFDNKSAFFNTGNVGELLHQCGYRLHSQKKMPSSYSVGYVADRVTSHLDETEFLHFGALPIPSGISVAFFRKADVDSEPKEKLSIILPAFNEVRYIRDVVEAVLAKTVEIEKEVIIVESNSSDGTRDIVREFEGRPGVKVLYEERAQGKGHAVRTGLAAASGSIILIQDADFEYDLDDYDALLKPILLRKTSFVLGSRSLGLDDWKVRRYASTPLRGLLMNLAQVGFAKTFNGLYQQNVTDVNTMFKVFRRECLNGVELVCDGFNLDIELACKIVKNGYPPMEVPVNYVSRGFDEGKKINFWRDAFPSYAAFFRYRFGG
jgi:ribosomal protein S27E